MPEQQHGRNQRTLHYRRDDRPRPSALRAVGAVLAASALVWAAAIPLARAHAIASDSRTPDDRSIPSALRDRRAVHYEPAEQCSALFDPAFQDEVAAAHPGARFTAAVHDHRTGCEYHLNRGLPLTTASVIKAQVLAGVLLAAQDAGRELNDSEAADTELMMHYSHNSPPTSRLYIALGGAAGMAVLDGRFGLTATSHRARYGGTVSTAEDRTVLIEQLLVGAGPLDEASVQAAWDWMSAVSAAQSWGVTAGLPAGYAAALKNGFYPMSGAGWRLGTTGVVRDPDGGTYAMTVMTDNNPTESAGIALVEQVARHINSKLAPGTPAPRAADDVTCVEPPAGSSWSSAARMLGGVDAAGLRHLNGGESAPLPGQRVCRP